jgi:hypothetical protein
MPTFLELPFEIRTIIWHHTATRDVDLGYRSLWNVKKSLVNLKPSVYLILTCRQFKADLESLDICHRFQLRTLPDCGGLFNILKTEIRPGTHFVVKNSVFKAPRRRLSKAMADSMDDTWLAMANRQSGMPQGSYKSAHVEGDGVNDSMGLAKVDFILTF